MIVLGQLKTITLKKHILRLFGIFLFFFQTCENKAVTCLSPGPDDSLPAPSVSLDLDPPSAGSKRTLQSFSWSSRGQQIGGGRVSGGASSGRSSQLAASDDRGQTEVCQDPMDAGV